MRVRKELRDVRRSLDLEIERLGTTLKVLNIALCPALLAIGAVLLPSRVVADCAPDAPRRTLVRGAQ